jgi:hypothetical protein
MPIDTPAAELVRQLSRVGLRPDERLVRRLLEQGDAARVALLALATDIAQLHAELPAALGPLHALRLLGELPDVAIIAPLLANIPIPIYGDQDVPTRLYATEVPQIIGRVGAPAVESLWAYADDEANGAESRSAAVGALAFVSARDPEMRASIAEEARRRLEGETPQPVLNGAVMLLADLGDSQSYKAVVAAYKAGKLDRSVVPAADVRQLMLGGGRRDLRCVNHPLFERYDHHGPRLRDPDEDDLDLE